MTSIPTPILNHVPQNLDDMVTQAERDVTCYERFLQAKREELEIFEQRAVYLQKTLDYWKSLRD